MKNTNQKDIERNSMSLFESLSFDKFFKVSEEYISNFETITKILEKDNYGKSSLYYVGFWRNIKVIKYKM